MTSETFFEYIANIFWEFLVINGIKLLVIVFLDGHTSHMSYDLSKFFQEHNIILVALYPGSPHILQPLDVAVFGPMKTKWKNIKRQWRIDNDGVEISKTQIPRALKTFIDDSMVVQNIKSGFRSTWIFPFDANAVDYRKIISRSEISIENQSNNNILSVVDPILVSSHLEFIEKILIPVYWSNLSKRKSVTRNGIN